MSQLGCCDKHDKQCPASLSHQIHMKSDDPPRMGCSTFLLPRPNCFGSLKVSSTQSERCSWAEAPSSAQWAEFKAILVALSHAALLSEDSLLSHVNSWSGRLKESLFGAAKHKSNKLLKY